MPQDASDTRREAAVFASGSPGNEAGNAKAVSAIAGVNSTVLTSAANCSSHFIKQTENLGLRLRCGHLSGHMVT